MDKSAKYAELIRLQKDSGLTVRGSCRNEDIDFTTGTKNFGEMAQEEIILSR